MSLYKQGTYLSEDEYDKMTELFLESYEDEYYNNNDTPIEEGSNNGPWIKMIFENYKNEDINDDIEEQVEIIVDENKEWKKTYFVDYVS